MGMQLVFHGSGGYNIALMKARKDPGVFAPASWTIVTRSPAETQKLGTWIGRALWPGCCIALYGDLGTGKTVLTKGIALGLGLEDPDEVTSPTFIIVNRYEARIPVNHIDAYRLADARELLDIGVDDLFLEDTVSVVEWAERVEAALPREKLEIRIAHLGSRKRKFAFLPRGRPYRDLVEKLRDAR